jgi:hypothetical protein
MREILVCLLNVLISIKKAHIQRFIKILREVVTVFNFKCVTSFITLVEPQDKLYTIPEMR